MEEGLKGCRIQVNDLRIVAQFDSTESIIAAVEEGLGISFVSKLAATPTGNARRVQLLSIIESFTQRYCLSYLKGKQDHPIIREFVSMVISKHNKNKPFDLSKWFVFLAFYMNNSRIILEINVLIANTTTLL
jgi:DNA-binding transcriptional LysR family regulator